VQVMGQAGRDDTLTDADRDFIGSIDAQIARSPNRTVVMYVHGYRVTFDEVAVQMGSFAHYLGQGATVTFQWPTGTKFWNYVSDCPQARRSIPDIARMVALLSRTQAQQVNLLAYSCGSPLLASALAQLREKYADLDAAALQKRFRIGNVIFAASDVDLKTFAREHVKPALDLSQQVIVYFSRADRALGFSSMIAGASRLGHPDLKDLEELSPKELAVMAEDPGFQAVDVTDVRGAHEMGGMKGRRDAVAALPHPAGAALPEEQGQFARVEHPGGLRRLRGEPASADVSAVAPLTQGWARRPVGGREHRSAPLRLRATALRRPGRTSRACRAAAPTRPRPRVPAQRLPRLAQAPAA
jgi:hypothetical protein